MNFSIPCDLLRPKLKAEVIAEHSTSKELAHVGLYFFSSAFTMRRGPINLLEEGSHVEQSRATPGPQFHRLQG